MKREPWLKGRVLLSPHAACYTEESRCEMKVEAGEQMLRAARVVWLRNGLISKRVEQPRTPKLDVDHRERCTRMVVQDVYCIGRHNDMC